MSLLNKALSQARLDVATGFLAKPSLLNGKWSTWVNHKAIAPVLAVSLGLSSSAVMNTSAEMLTRSPTTVTQTSIDGAHLIDPGMKGNLNSSGSFNFLKAMQPDTAESYRLATLRLAQQITEFKVKVEYADDQRASASEESLKPLMLNYLQAREELVREAGQWLQIRNNLRSNNQDTSPFDQPVIQALNELRQSFPHAVQEHNTQTDQLVSVESSPRP